MSLHIELACLTQRLTWIRVTKRGAKKVVPASKDYFNRLPAELRNAVYELVLVEQKILVVGSVKGYRKRDNHELTLIVNRRGKYRIRPWTEPGILQTCKAVRQEASPLYYRRNEFVAFAKVVQFERLGSWLKQLSRRCGPQLFETFRISVVRGATWLPLDQTLHLARVFHNCSLQVWPSASPFMRALAPSEEADRYPLAHVHDAFHSQPHINALLELGQQAGREKRSRGWLERRLTKYMGSLLGRGGKVYRSSNWNVRKLLEKNGFETWGKKLPSSPPPCLRGRTNKKGTRAVMQDVRERMSILSSDEDTIVKQESIEDVFA